MCSAIMHIYEYMCIVCVCVCLYVTSKTKVLFHGIEFVCSEFKICLIQITALMGITEVLVGERTPNRVLTQRRIYWG